VVGAWAEAEAVKEASEAAAEANVAWRAEAADSAAREADTARAAAVVRVVLVAADSAAALGALAEERVALAEELPVNVVELPVNVVVMPALVEEPQEVPDPHRTATSSAGFLACPQTRGYRMAIPLA
jgi:hypothetical protein